MVKIEKSSPDWFENKKFLLAFAEEYPHLLDVQQLIKEIRFGKLHLTFTVADERVVSMEINSQQLVRYDLGERVSERRVT